MRSKRSNASSPRARMTFKEALPLSVGRGPGKLQADNSRTREGQRLACEDVYKAWRWYNKARAFPHMRLRRKSLSLEHAMRGNKTHYKV